MCRQNKYPTEKEPKLNKEGPDEKHVGTGVAFTLRRLKLGKLFSGFGKKKPRRILTYPAGQVRLRTDV